MNRRRVVLRSALLAAVVASLGLLGAGCGGGSKSPAVASLGTTAASSSGGASSKSLFPPGVGGVGASMSTQVGTGAVGVRYTGCMRSHGVPSFPDPDATGTLTITVSPSLNPSSPLFQKAEADCQHLVPAGKRLSAARQQQAKQRALAFAACMRSHGVPKYPDPTFSNGGISQGINRRDVDPSSPSFQAAQKTCRSIGGPS